LADSGVTDPQELRRRTLENFDFKLPALVVAMPVHLSQTTQEDTA
jgi:hypothetical protein